MAASAYGCAVGGLAQAVLTIVRKFRQINPESIAWDAQQLAYPRAQRGPVPGARAGQIHPGLTL